MTTEMGGGRKAYRRLYYAQRGHCPLCILDPVPSLRSGFSAHRAHMRPDWMGGSNHPDNFALLCPTHHALTEPIRPQKETKELQSVCEQQIAALNVVRDHFSRAPFLSPGAFTAAVSDLLRRQYVQSAELLTRLETIYRANRLRPSDLAYALALEMLALRAEGRCRHAELVFRGGFKVFTSSSSASSASRSLYTALGARVLADLGLRKRAAVLAAYAAKTAREGSDEWLYGQKTIMELDDGRDSSSRRRRRAESLIERYGKTHWRISVVPTIVDFSAYTMMGAEDSGDYLAAEAVGLQSAEKLQDISVSERACRLANVAILRIKRGDCEMGLSTLEEALRLLEEVGQKVLGCRFSFWAFDAARDRQIAPDTLVALARNVAKYQPVLLHGGEPALLRSTEEARCFLKGTRPGG